MDYNDLKIQFRAVPYGTDNHVLEYRIDPKQDGLEYTEERKLFGIFRYTKTRKYDTDWRRPIYFFNHNTAYLHDENDDWNWFPLSVHGRKALDWYKNNFKTYGEFSDYVDAITKKNKDAWLIERSNYLKRKEIMY